MSEAMPATLPAAVRAAISGGRTCFVATASGDAVPNVIPVSWIVAVDDLTIRVALYRGHQTTANIRANGRVSISVMAPGVASTIQGTARVVKESLDADADDVLVEVTVTQVQENAGGALIIDDGPSYSWAIDDGPDREERVIEELSGK